MVSSVSGFTASMMAWFCSAPPRSGPAPSFSGLLQPIPVTVHGQDVNVVGQPVEQRAGEPFGPQHRGPVLERRLEVTMVELHS